MQNKQKIQYCFVFAFAPSFNSPTAQGGAIASHFVDQNLG